MTVGVVAPALIALLIAAEPALAVGRVASAAGRVVARGRPGRTGRRGPIRAVLPAVAAELAKLLAFPGLAFLGLAAGGRVLRRRRSALLTFRTRGPVAPVGPLGAIRPLRTIGPLCTVGPLGAVGTLLPVRPFGAVRSFSAFRALRTVRSLGAIRAFGAVRPLRAFGTIAATAFAAAAALAVSAATAAAFTIAATAATLAVAAAAPTGLALVRLSDHDRALRARGGER